MIRTLLIASLATLAATEAEPKADADPYLVYGGYPYTHGLTHGLTYGAYNPYYTLPVVKAAEAEVKAVDAEEKKTVVPLHYPINYGYYGHPLTHHYYGKREAEPTADAAADAKADPWLAYSGYTGYPYTHGLTYGAYNPYYTHPVVTKAAVKAADGEEKAVVPLTLPYGGLYNYGYGYTGYPVVKSVAGTKTIVPTLHSGLHYYGKRSADAEPEAAADADAAADPWLTYGYSGYGHGLYRPYGYRAHYGGYLGGYGGYRSYGYGGYPYYG
jgi:hypothetical protein